MMKESILEVFKYFSNFNYPPTFEDIYTFLRKKCSKRRLASILEKMRQQKQISCSDSESRYTIPEYKNKTDELRITNYEKRKKISGKKIKKIQFYVKLLSIFSQIKLIGLSGSVAMLNADESHDMDLFIITAKNRLWTGRFIALLLAQVIGVRRKRADHRSTFHVPRFRDKVCLNLFFDEADLAVPKFKRSEYVAHEVLQMKPLEQKDGMYLRFIDANRWVFDIFPNVRKVVSSQKIVVGKEKVLATNYLLLSTFGNILEFLLNKLQLFFINRHRTNEIVTSSQLWFHPVKRGSHPEDFGEKIKI